MFSYVCIGSNDMDRAIRFYDAVMAPLGHLRCDTDPKGQNATWGLDDPGPHLWVTLPFDGAAPHPGNGTMFSLLAASRAQVDAVYTAALTLGAACEGPPGPRPQYGAHFYAAYLRDPDGNKFNAVCYAAAT
jgi:catechol 2,3-dioxygenase-like lactoylglutathione lyase family enzyme